MKLNCKEVKTEVVTIQKEIIELEEILKGFPEGELLCSKNDTRYKFKDPVCDRHAKRRLQLFAWDVLYNDE